MSMFDNIVFDEFTLLEGEQAEAYKKRKEEEKASAKEEDKKREIHGQKSYKNSSIHDRFNAERLAKRELKNRRKESNNSEKESMKKLDAWRHDMRNDKKMKDAEEAINKNSKNAKNISNFTDNISDNNGSTVSAILRHNRKMSKNNSKNESMIFSNIDFI